MAQRSVHYEAAFEDYLRCMGLPYVAVDEAKKEIEAVIQRNGGELLHMQNPTMTLEELFLNIVADSEARPGRRARRE